MDVTTGETSLKWTADAEKKVFNIEGDVILAQDPTKDLGAATKQYVDTHNVIIYRVKEV